MADCCRGGCLEAISSARTQTNMESTILTFRAVVDDLRGYTLVKKSMLSHKRLHVGQEDSTEHDTHNKHRGCPE